MPLLFANGFTQIDGKKGTDQAIFPFFCFQADEEKNTLLASFVNGSLFLSRENEKLFF